MKKSIVTAIASSIGSYLIASFAGALVLAGAMNAAHAPSFGAARTVWDQYLVTPISFLIAGIIFGAIASTGNDLKTVLKSATATAVALAIIIVVGIHALMLQLQGPLREQGYNVTVGPLAGHDFDVQIGASLLWIAWFVAGAAIAVKVRERQTQRLASNNGDGI
jgi:hypothetical protein